MRVPSLIIGVGNAQRGDDAAGLALVAALDGCVSIDTVLCQGDMTQLFDLWQGHASVLVADMIQLPGARVGAIHRFDVSQHGLPYAASHSSHGLGIAQAVEMARALDVLPSQIEIVGIVGGDTSLGAPLSPDGGRSGDLAGGTTAAGTGTGACRACMNLGSCAVWYAN